MTCEAIHMSKTKLSTGLSHLAIALLIIPLVIGGAAYVAVSTSAIASPTVRTAHQATMIPTTMPAGNEVQHREIFRDCHKEVSIEGTVVNVSICTDGKATLIVESSNGEIHEVLIGGKWLGPNKTLLTPKELATNVTVGDHVVITAFIACDGDLRATKINVDGVTHELTQGPWMHGLHVNHAWGTHRQSHHNGECGECPSG